MKIAHNYYVYVVSNLNRTIYIGVTNDIVRRVAEHRQRSAPGFTAKYGIDMLVYIEWFGNIDDAIAREKQLKGWSRAKKLALIAKSNPNWEEILPA